MFGRKIGSFQLVQELLAEISTTVTTSRLLCYYALDCVDKGREPAQRHGQALLDRRLPARGLAGDGSARRHGHQHGLGLEELYRDVRMLPIPDGTNQIPDPDRGVRAITGISALR